MIKFMYLFIRVYWARVTDLVFDDKDKMKYDLTIRLK